MDHIMIYRRMRIGLVGVKTENGSVVEIELPMPGDQQQKSASDLLCDACCPASASKARKGDLVERTFRELEEYFSGKRETFDIPVVPKGTPFMQRVWKELLKIPYGSTLSYKDIAIKVGSPKGFRAVGGAVHRNPVPILIPCHRIIGANGSLVGFANGLDLKRLLLDLEKKHAR
ncbi:MAG: methylated-DNA--[protein]-cysteine S-methyltransferase [Planctomycetia bacterium]|nr:methylated-DNA--[protein]-cysteine S-methyltransferase [Planctomycetia bacterium]